MAACTSVMVEPASKGRSCCGNMDQCKHTIVQHGKCTGFLADGELLCMRDGGPLRPCKLDDISESKCALVPLLEGHRHGPGCGHETIPHGDHMDYLVGEHLHHVVSEGTGSCCKNECQGLLSAGSVVDHGPVNVLRQRKGHGQHGSQDTCISPEVAADGMQASPSTVTKVHAAGICCPSEVPVIHSLLDHLPGVVNVDVVVVTKQVIVTHDPALMPPAALVAALNSAHLEASLTGHHLVQVSMSWLPPWRILLCGFFVLVSWFGKITSPAWLEYFKYAALGAVLLGAPPVVLRAFGALRARTLDINTLMIIAVAGAIALQDYEEGGTIVFLFALAEWLEDKCISKARGALASVLTLQPETAVLASTGEAVPAQQIVVDDEVLVRPGDKVPVDGTVIRGSTTMDESMLTGESKPVAKSVESIVLAGTLNSGSGPVVVKATAPAAASAVAKLASLVQEAVAQKSATERFIQVFARWYTPIVVLAAVLVALIPSLLHRESWREWTYLALVVLVTACPCALVISTPVATVCAIARAAKHGVLVKGSAHLEALAKVQIITMDKSGTLTAGNFQVVAAHYFSEGHNNSQVLGYAAALEQQSPHPLASAVLGYAAANNALVASHIATNVHVLPGLGITGQVSGHMVAVGNALLMQKQHTAAGTASSSQASKDDSADITWDSATASAQALAEAAGSEYGASACYVSVDGALVGLLLLCDSVRPYAAEALTQLRHKCGVHVAMLTGDNRVAACSVAAQLGMDAADVHAALLPQDKLALLGQYKLQYGHIAHVGDGVNDAPALAAATVGVAMGAGGTALAVEAADLALFTNNLTTLVLALLLSRRMMWIIRINIAFSVAVKLVVLALAGSNRVTLWAAVLADVGSAIIVVCLSLTLLRFGNSATKSISSHGPPPCAGECGGVVAQAKHDSECCHT